jgi:hypothetical protein
MGLVDVELPQNIKLDPALAPPNEDCLVIKERLADAVGEREATLAFKVKDDHQGVTVVADAAFLIGDRVAPGDDGADQALAENFVGALSWTIDGRRFAYASELTGTEKLTYRFDPTDQQSSGNSGAGANVVPSIIDIVVDPANMVSLAGLADTWTATLPTVKYLLNPVETTQRDDSNVATYIEVTPGSGSGLEWVGDHYYTVPAHISAAAGGNAGDVIPSELIALWYSHSVTGEIDRVEGTEFGEELVFELPSIAGAGMPHEAANDPTGSTSRYIIAFAGQSLADALAAHTWRLASHTHGPDGASRPVAAKDLAGQFDPNKWAHSVLYRNHFPQYLERGGYQTDALNRNNAMLGHLHLGTTNATPSNTVSPDDTASNSYRITFGDNSGGPSIYFNGAGARSALKLGTAIDNMVAPYPIEFSSGTIYLGDITTGPYFETIFANQGADRTDLLSDVGAFATLGLGKLVSTEGELRLSESLGFITGEDAGGIFLFRLGRTTAADTNDTQLEVGELIFNQANLGGVSEEKVYIGATSFQAIHPKDGTYTDYKAGTDLSTDYQEYDTYIFDIYSVPTLLAFDKEPTLVPPSLSLSKQPELKLATSGHSVAFANIPWPSIYSTPGVPNVGSTNIEIVNAILYAATSSIAAGNINIKLRVVPLPGNAGATIAYERNGSTAAVWAGAGSFEAIDIDGGAVGDVVIASDSSLCLDIVSDGNSLITILGAEITFRATYTQI